MGEGRDPVEARSGDDRDLYEVSGWEVRSSLDRLAVRVHAGVLSALRGLVVVLAALILLVQFALGGLGAVVDPFVGAFTLLSVIPALGLAAYIWYADVTEGEPLELLVATFVLGVLFAGFAAVGNTAANQGFANLGLLEGTVGLVGQALFFYAVVGPVEESVKLLAVRLYAYRKPAFDAVVDGAVYGAVAGFGFATIENAIYITRTTAMVEDPLNLVAQGSAIAAVRALAGPGHVIYSAFAGYYLGLAKFNPENAGPIVVKGLLVAAGIHATYNTLVGFVPGLVADAVGVSPLVAFFGFVSVYDGVFGLALLGKLARYRRAYREVHDGAYDGGVERTEFDP